MGNPVLRTDPFAAGLRSALDNGDLGLVGGDFISQGSQLLPKAGPELGKGTRGEVVLASVPRFGLVRMTYEVSSYRHRRNQHWHWRAVRADAITLELRVVDYPWWVNDYWWPAGR